MESIIIILIALAIIAIYDAIGSILSRKLNFEYVWLTFGSFVIYGLIALYLEKYDGLIISIIGSFLIGMFDSTIGLLIAKKLNANILEKDKEAISITPKLVISMGSLASIIGILSILLFS